MAKQVINIGTTANDGTGDPLRTAMTKVNSNFTEVYNAVGVQGANVASASTTNIFLTDGDFRIVTGNVTITSLGTANTGVYQEVKFTGTPTLTYNATSLILPSLANIVVAAGDCAGFRSLGSGNVECVWYKRADGTALLNKEIPLESTLSGSGTKTLVFDRARSYYIAQTGALTLALGSGNANYNMEIVIDGNGVDTLTIPTTDNWLSINGIVFDNTKRNYIYLQYSYTEVKYAIVTKPIPVIDVINPYVVSAVVVVSNKSQIRLVMNEACPVVSSYANFTLIAGGKTITGISTAGIYILLNVSADFTSGETATIAYNHVANDIEDASGNDLLSFSAMTITTNLFVDQLAVTNRTTLEILKKTNPTNIDFNNDGQFSIAWDFKQATFPTTGNNMWAIVLGETDKTSWNVGLEGNQIAAYMEGAFWQYTKGGTALSTATKYRCVVNFNTIAGTMDCYINNVLQTSMVNSGSGTTGTMRAMNSNTKLCIGGSPYTGAEATNTGGKVDNVLIIDRILTGGERTEHYNSGGAMIDPVLLSFNTSIKAAYLLEGDGSDYIGSNVLTSTNPALYTTF